MKVSYYWLKSYVKDLPEPESVVDAFTFHICEVESADKISIGDTIFDIKVLPDRAHDLLSHKGIAKDLASVLNLEFKDRVFDHIDGGETSLTIKIESEFCRRYMGRIVRGVEVGISPVWMKNYLESIGQRSITNLVDATNITMFDVGNPIHVFDLDKVSGGIIVRNAKDGEVMTTLDGKEIKLNSTNMVIADEKEILAIAGVKGGKKAEVDANTKNIIIEVANFDPINVRKTSKAINIYTDALKRYENDFSQEIASVAMSEISALMKEMCPNAVFEKVVDVYPKKQELKTLNFNIKKISKIIGLEISTEETENILRRCGFEYKKDGDNYSINVPAIRLDLNIEEDMAEEIGRMIGYDKIKAELPKVEWAKEANQSFAKIQYARNKLLNDGHSEVMTYAFCDKGEVEVLASASDKKFLRTNLTDGLKESLKLNQLNAPLLDLNEVKIFEIGTVFMKDKEEIHVAYNDKKPARAGGNVIEVTLDEFVSEKLSPEEHGYFSAEKFLVLAPSRSQASSEETFQNKLFQSWSVYPFISRDVAVWVREGESPDELKKLLKKNATDLLVREPYLFDSFTKNGKTSYAFRLVFQSFEKTLTDDEINVIMTKISHKIKENSRWELR